MSTLKRWLLVNYAGHPFAPNSLMPDNGLANLASALLQSGCEVEILDYCTLETLRQCSSEELRCGLTKAWTSLRHGSGSVWSKLTQLSALAHLHRYDAARRRLQQQAVARISTRILDRIHQRDIEAVGFKLWNGDGLVGTVQIAAHIRKHAPNVKIFGGGPHVDIFMEHLLSHYEEFDAMIYGEGEAAIQPLVQHGQLANEYDQIPNLLYRQNNRVIKTPEKIIADLDELPMPVYDADVYPAMKGDEKIKIIVVDESRGCRNNCAFCPHPIKSSHRQRVKSIPRLMQEIDRFGKDLNIHTFRFAGSCTPYPLLNQFAAEVIKTQRQLTYSSFAHIRHSADADFASMRRSGCVSLFFGIESGNQAVLDKMRKGTRVDEIPVTLRRAKEAGIFTVGSIIYPAPGDTIATGQETLQLMLREKPDAMTIQAPVVTPRTDWFESPAQYGITIHNRNQYLIAAMTWKLSLLLPPAFWGPLPLLIDGKNYRQVLKATSQFMKQVRSHGLVTSISDDTYLMSQRLGMNPIDFRDQTGLAFFAGDTGKIATLIESINARV
jgi:hypothetical protein